MLRRVHEYVTLLGRNFRVLLADRFSLMMTVFLTPFIAVFVMLAFWLIRNDTHTNDNRVFAAQLFFDTFKLTTEQLASGNNDAPPALFSYPAENAAKAMEDFQEDYILYSWLYPEVADRGEKEIDFYREEARKHWCGDENNNDIRFIPDFVVFRYNLPRMLLANEADRPYKWPQYRVKHTEEIEKDMLTRRAEATGKLKKHINGEESTRSHMTVFFILIATAIWMGLLPACKEIVAEWEVFLRESRSNISSLAFLLSKFTMLAIVTAIQDAILIGMVCRWWQKMPWQHCTAIYLILVLTSACAVSLGLFISGVTSTLRQGLMIIPIVMIVQLILGGLLRLPAQTRDDSRAKPLREAASKAMVQYWAFEAVTSIISRLPEVPGTDDKAVLLRRDVRMLKNPEDKVGSDRNTVDYYTESETVRIDDYIFGKGTPPEFLLKAKKYLRWCDDADKESFVYHAVRPFFYLLCANVALLVVTCVWIKLRLAIDYNSGLLALLFRV